MAPPTLGEPSHYVLYQVLHRHAHGPTESSVLLRLHCKEILDSVELTTETNHFTGITEYGLRRIWTLLSHGELKASSGKSHRLHVTQLCC